MERRIGRRILDLETAVDKVVERVECGERDLDVRVATPPSGREPDVCTGFMERESTLERGIHAGARRASELQPHETAIQLKEALVAEVHVRRPAIIERNPRFELRTDCLVTGVDAAAPVPRS